MKRQTRPLPSSLEHQLSTYALAAGATGVCILTLAQQAEGKVVYTPTHVVISVYGMHAYNLDLNLDGKTDFVIESTWTNNSDSSAIRLIASAAHGNGVETYKGGAAALKAEKKIGSGRRFGARELMISDRGSPGVTTSMKRGNWINVNNRYLGLKFRIMGKTHYGWARVSVQAQTKLFYVVTTITGYAYETIPNKPIIAGKTHGKDDMAVRPASLGALAAGSSVLSTWRHNQGASK